MKKLFLALFAASMFIFASCSNEIDKKIDRLEELKEQSIKLDEAGANEEEYIEIAAEAMKIVGELMEMEKDMTQEQKDRVEKIMED